MSEKYSNGMYKGESPRQAITSQNIFTAFYQTKHLHNFDYMSVNFDQNSGLCTYAYTFKNTKSVYYIAVNRVGNIVDSGFTTN